MTVFALISRSVAGIGVAHLTPEVLEIGLALQTLTMLWPASSRIVQAMALARSACGEKAVDL